jgi:hypothetical protein
MISGGYYIKARCIGDSEIAHQPPHYRELWDWLLANANHTDRKIYGKTIHRGQLHCTIDEIREGLHWHIGYRKQTYKKHDCENAMKWLTRAEMVTTAKTGRGTIITICNYDYYQNPDNYGNRTGNRTGNGNHAGTMPNGKQEGKNVSIKDTSAPDGAGESVSGKKQVYPQDFTEWFWQHYPKKRGKGGALKEWRKLSKAAREAIRDILPEQVAQGYFSPDLNYIKDPERYLKARCWDDDLPQATGSQRVYTPDSRLTA